MVPTTLFQESPEPKASHMGLYHQRPAHYGGPFSGLVAVSVRLFPTHRGYFLIYCIIVSGLWLSLTVNSQRFPPLSYMPTTGIDGWSVRMHPFPDLASARRSARSTIFLVCCLYRDRFQSLLTLRYPLGFQVGKSILTTRVPARPILTR